jgi:hypothetical protein
MQPDVANVALCLFWLYGYLLLHPFDQDSRSTVLKVLLPLRACQLDSVLLHALWGIHLGKHHFLDKHPGTRVLASKY